MEVGEFSVFRPWSYNCTCVGRSQGLHGALPKFMGHYAGARICLYAWRYRILVFLFEEKGPWMKKNLVSCHLSFCLHVPMRGEIWGGRMDPIFCHLQSPAVMSFWFLLYSGNSFFLSFSWVCMHSCVCKSEYSWYMKYIYQCGCCWTKVRRRNQCLAMKVESLSLVCFTTHEGRAWRSNSTRLL